MTFPNDETGGILQEMQDAGINLSVALPVEFFQLFEQEQDARAMAAHIEKEMPQATVKVHPDQTPKVWDVDVTIEMIPSHQNITEQEQAFEKLSAKFNGYNDGWGVQA